MIDFSKKSSRSRSFTTHTSTPLKVEPRRSFNFETSWQRLWRVAKENWFLVGNIILIPVGAWMAGNVEGIW